MSIGNSVYSLLLGNSGVTALVSDRIYPLRAPQDTAKPYVVFFVVSSEHDRHLHGPSGVVEKRIQVDAYADTYEAAHAVSEAIRRALNGYSGTPVATKISRISLLTERDADEGADTLLHRASQDYQIDYYE